VPIAPAGYGPATQDTSLPSDPNTGLISIWSDPTNLPASDSKAFWDSNIWFGDGLKTVQNGNPDSSVSAPHSKGGPTFDDVGNPAKSHTASFDQNMSARDLMKQFAAMAGNPNMAGQWQSIQALLKQGNWYGSSTTTVQGGWNPQSEKALADALYSYIQVSQGAGVAINFQQYLADVAAKTAANGGGASGGGSSSPLLTDQGKLTRYAQMAAQNSLGRSLTKDELTKFVDQFHNEQINSYTQAAGHNGLSAQKDDPRSSAIDFVTSNNQPEFQQHQTQGYADAFLNMFLPSTSAAPNVPLDPQAVGY
jgi:hypothetical protein